MRTTKETVIVVETDDAVRIELEEDAELRVLFHGRMIKIKALDDDTEPRLEIEQLDGVIWILDSKFEYYELPRMFDVAPFPHYITFGAQRPAIRAEVEFSDHALSMRAENAEKDSNHWTLCSCGHLAQDHALDGLCTISTCVCKHYDGRNLAITPTT